MSLNTVYKFCRPWAVAEDAEERTGALTPVAPYAVDMSVEVNPVTNHRPWPLTCTYRASYAKGWSKDWKSQTQTMPVAGGGASDREPHCSLEAAQCIQHGGERMESQYQTASNANALRRFHRHKEKVRNIPHSEREARWYKCFRQFEGQWEHSEDAKTRVTGTDFSVLPAGYQPKHGRLQAWGKAGARKNIGATDERKLVEGASASPGKKSASDAGGSPRKASASMASSKYAKLEGDDASTGRNQAFGGWRKKGELKGAEYVKADMVPSWLRKHPAKSKQADLVAALKPCADPAPAEQAGLAARGR